MRRIADRKRVSAGSGRDSEGIDGVVDSKCQVLLLLSRALRA